jgi:hypothetical protein
MLMRVLSTGTAATLGLLSTMALAATAAPKLPSSGRVLSLQNGDLMCYVQLRDSRGRKHDLGAIFELCENNRFLRKQVKLSYRRVRVNDCQSAEPCGKTRWATLITKMRVIK